MSAARALPLLLASLAAAPAALAAQAATPTATPGAQTPDAPVRAAVAEFVNALNALDAARLGRTMAEDITVFFPGPPFPAARVQGRASVQGAFAQLFAALRQRGASSAGLQPRALDVQLYGDTAVATFHLTGGQREIGRRTLVLRRVGGRWLVVHMHASVAQMLTPPAAPPRPAASPAPPRPAPVPSR